MKLCPKAVAIKAGYWDSGSTDHEIIRLQNQNDKRTMVKHLHRHMAACKLCST